MLCPFPRPNFVSPAVYEQIRGVCRGIFRAIEKVEARLGEDLWDRVDLTPEERELVRIDPGYARSSPTSRLDSFVTTDAYQFVELNAESPAGIAYAEVLVDLFLELPIMKRFQERYRLRRFRARERAAGDARRLLPRGGGQGGEADHRHRGLRGRARPAPSTTSSASSSRRSGYPSLVCDPRHLTYEGGRLRHDGRAIDIVYKRLLVNEFLERIDELQPLLQAARDRAVTMVNPFRCKPIHKKAIFAVLTDDELQPLFTAEERAAIAAHVPWTRRVRRGADHARRAGDRPRPLHPRATATAWS